MMAETQTAHVAHEPASEMLYSTAGRFSGTHGAAQRHNLS